MKEDTNEGAVLSAAVVDIGLQLVDGHAPKLQGIVTVTQLFLVVVDVKGRGVGKGLLVVVERRGEAEGLEGLVGEGVGAVGLVWQPSLDLQCLPYGPQPVHIGVVQDEDRVEGAVVESGQRELREASHHKVRKVVDDLELHLKVAEVSLLEGQQHSIEEIGVVAELRVLKKVILYLEKRRGCIISD